MYQLLSLQNQWRLQFDDLRASLEPRDFRGSCPLQEHELFRFQYRHRRVCRDITRRGPKFTT